MSITSACGDAKHLQKSEMKKKRNFWRRFGDSPKPSKTDETFIQIFFFYFLWFVRISLATAKVAKQKID